MMHRLNFLISAALLAIVVDPLVALGAQPDRTVRLGMDSTRVVNRVDEKIYGHFLEHIYHSVNGGLWGEMVWDRSFEERIDTGGWSLENEQLVQRGTAENLRLTFGDPAWRDYEFTLEAKKTAGREGFLILFRTKNEKNFYWCNLGGWGNTRHGLERGRGGEGRWRPIGPSIDGVIQTDRWYRVKVRCEGKRFRAWLDDKLLIDFTDDDRGHPAGKVGVGTWRTQARFRNLKVTALDGKVLHEGLPEVTSHNTSRRWKAYGPGSIQLVTEQPLNSNYSQRIVARDEETGLRQQPFCLRKGETYHGSLYARGRAPDGLVVRFRDGQEVIMEKRLPAPTDQWKPYPFEFVCPRSAEDATLEIGVKGDAAVWIDQVSLMSGASRAAAGFRPDLLRAVGELKPPIIRWPGGCFVEWYRWKDGVGPQHRRGVYPKAIWGDVDVNSFGTDEFVALCRKVGAEPLIVINIGSHEPKEEQASYIKEACEWIRYCNGPAESKWGKLRAANGHPEPYNVKYWEIDNETWFMKSEPYAEAVCRFAPEMKKADPSIKIIACGSYVGNRSRGHPWDQVILDRCAKQIDYLSIHHYENPDNFARGPLADEQYYRETARQIDASANPKIKIYCSEWNAQSTDWRTGLYAGGLLNVFERLGSHFEIGGPALFLRHVSARAWDNAFVNFDHRTWFPAPNYVVMKLWRQHYAPNRIALTGDAGPLNVVATKSADGKTLYLKAVNPSEKPVPVELTVKDGFQVDSAAIKLVAPGSLQARNTLDQPNTVRPVPGKVEADGRTLRLELPRWSAAVITIQAQ